MVTYKQLVLLTGKTFKWNKLILKVLMVLNGLGI